MILVTGANDEFANAARGIGSAIGRLRGEALVIVVMAAAHHIGVGFVERLEKRLSSDVVAVGAAGSGTAARIRKVLPLTSVDPVAMRYCKRSRLRV